MNDRQYCLTVLLILSISLLSVTSVLNPASRFQRISDSTYAAACHQKNNMWASIWLNEWHPCAQYLDSALWYETGGFGYDYVAKSDCFMMRAHLEEKYGRPLRCGL